MGPPKPSNPCSPCTAATPMFATSRGSSPKHSALRPNRGSVATLSTGASPWTVPLARACNALLSAMSRTSVVFHDAPCPAGIGKTVQPGCPPECSISAVKATGICSRDDCNIAVCAAFSLTRSESVLTCTPTDPTDVLLNDLAKSSSFAPPLPSIWFTLYHRAVGHGGRSVS